MTTAAPTVSNSDRLEQTRQPPVGIMRFLTAVNHRVVGARYLVTGFIFFLLAGIAALLMRIQLAVPENTFLDPDLYNQIFSTHGTTMMFLFAVPIMEGIGIYLTPLMIGARDMAFPKLNADNFDHTELDFIGGASIACGWDSYVPISIQGESLPYEDQFLDLDPNYKDAYGLPLLRITYDFHQNNYNLYRFITARCREIMAQMGPSRLFVTPELEPYNSYTYQSTHNTGGAIRGSDPGNSVTNKYGQVWDTPNVFVTGAVLYPQNPGMNPTGPLFAHTYLAGDGIRDRYLQNPGQIIV